MLLYVCMLSPYVESHLAIQLCGTTPVPVNQCDESCPVSPGVVRYRVDTVVELTLWFVTK